MAERLKAAVLKTANPQGFVGSNPTPSATPCPRPTRVSVNTPCHGVALEAVSEGASALKLPSRAWPAAGSCALDASSSTGRVETGSAAYQP